MIQHIKKYYHMIFLDYENLADQSQLLEFDWIIFYQVQYPTPPGSTIIVAKILRMFLPLSNLVSQLQTVSISTQNVSRFEADESTKELISWIIH